MAMWIDEENCAVVLLCPACGSVDVDFDFIAYREFGCSLCGALVNVTHYMAYLRGDQRPVDVVECLGERMAA